MFEKRKEKLAPIHVFYWRLARSIAVGMSIIFVSLFAGMIGYHYYEQMSWIDAFANASMILSGMGPLTPLETYNGKLFAGIYALYSGFAVIIVMGVMFAPVAHRFFHKFHLDMEKK